MNKPETPSVGYRKELDEIKKDARAMHRAMRYLYKLVQETEKLQRIADGVEEFSTADEQKCIFIIMGTLSGYDHTSLAECMVDFYKCLQSPESMYVYGTSLYDWISEDNYERRHLVDPYLAVEWNYAKRLATYKAYTARKKQEQERIIADSATCAKPLVVHKTVKLTPDLIAQLRATGLKVEEV